MKTTQVRSLVLALALALVLVVAVPASAQPPALDGTWLTTSLDQLGRWWNTLWGHGPGSIQAGSEAAPNLDPDGTTTEPQDPGNSSLTNQDETSGGEAEAFPRLDPDG